MTNDATAPAPYPPIDHPALLSMTELAAARACSAATCAISPVSTPGRGAASTLLPSNGLTSTFPLTWRHRSDLKELPHAFAPGGKRKSRAHHGLGPLGQG